MRFALSTLLLLVTIFGLTIALVLEWTRKPEVLYLHVLKPDEMHVDPPTEWQPIATISVVSGAPLYADIPCCYEPLMMMEGTVVRHGDFVDTKFTIDVHDPILAYSHKQNLPIPLNPMHDFSEGWGDHFKFSVSDSWNAPVISPTASK